MFCIESLMNPPLPVMCYENIVPIRTAELNLKILRNAN